MTTLDYALLAEYARVDPGGLLTVVGGSFGRIFAPSLPTQQQLYVAARLLFEEGETAANFEVKIRTPDDQVEINIGGEIECPSDVPLVEGVAGVAVAAGAQIPLPSEGTYRVTLDLDGERVRSLAFVVEAAPAQGGS